MNHFLSKILGCDGDCPWRVIYTGDRAVSALDKAVGDAKYFGRIYAFMILGLHKFTTAFCVFFSRLLFTCCSNRGAPGLVAATTLSENQSKLHKAIHRFS